MRLLSVTARGVAWGHLDRLRDRIAERFAGDGFRVQWRRNKDGDETVVLSGKAGPDAFVLDNAVDCLADFIVCDLEPVLIEETLETEYGDLLGGANRDMLMSFCAGVLDRLRGDRRADIARAARAYFEAEREMELEGFLVFRLRDYMADVFTAVLNGWDHYEAYRQYGDFVAALKLIMFLRPARVPLVHLFRRENGDLMLTDENGVPLGPAEPGKPPIAVVPADGRPAAAQEQLVSTLMTVSPQKIRIHLRKPDWLRPERVFWEDDSPEEALLRTIHHVFASRIEWCGGCPLDNAPFSGIISESEGPDGAPRGNGNRGCGRGTT